MQKPRKLGRPRLDAETEQVAVRLPKPWVDAMRPHLSQNIRNRLYRSLFEEQIAAERDPHMVKIAGQIEELANSVRRATGADWHADHISHQIFLETLRLLFASLPAPTAELSSVKLDPQTAAQTIFNIYAATVRDLERNRKTGMDTPLSRLMENDNG